MLRKFHSILLVEDHFMTNMYNEKLINDLCISDHVITIESGREALGYLMECMHHHTIPDLIVVDIFMPAMSGWEFIDLIQKMEFGKGKRPPVIVLTTSHNQEDEKRAFSYPDVVAYLTKPLTEISFMGAIRNHFGKRFAEA